MRGNEPGNGLLPSAAKVAGGLGIRTCGLYGDDGRLVHRMGLTCNWRVSLVIVWDVHGSGRAKTINAD